MLILMVLINRQLVMELMMYMLCIGLTARIQPLEYTRILMMRKFYLGQSVALFFTISTLSFGMPDIPPPAHTAAKLEQK